ncbi:unnamed protein product, partial [Laminaria digitata]
GILAGVLSDSTNSKRNLETPGERIRRARKERLNPGSSEGRDRWADEENSNTRNAFTSLGNPTGLFRNNASSGGAGTLPGKHDSCVDAEGNIDYLRVMTNRGDGGGPSPAGGVSRLQNASGVFHTHGGGKRGEGLLPSRSSLGGSSRLGGAVAVPPWKKMLELDEEERKQVDAAMAASQEEACERGAAHEESELDRAIRLSREEEPLSPTTMMMLTPPEEEFEAAQLEAL